MTLLIGALTIGLIMSLLSMGVYISFRIFELADITVDGSITFGAAVAAVLLSSGMNPACATLCGFAAGALAGFVTGILQTRFGIDALLAGILVMTALYSVNLHVMGKSNVPLLDVPSLSTWCEGWASSWLGSSRVEFFGWTAHSRDLGMLALVFACACAAGAALYWFFRTQIGCAMRATGDNPQMIRALGGGVENYRVLGLALSNGLVGLAGALLAQYQAFADVQMGIGMVVFGFASVIIGEALVGASGLGYAIVGAIIGSVLFRLLTAIVLRWGLNPNDLKLITAVFVFAALYMPVLMRRRQRGAHA